MLPIGDEKKNRSVPYVTYTLIFLNVVIYLWDRGGGLFGPSSGFADLAMRPTEVVRAVRGTGDPTSLTGLFTSLFLHGNLAHLIGNMIFLLTFGDDIEEAFGPAKFILLYLFWGVMASLAHIFVMPGSSTPVLGASGAIGGILGCYFLLYPANQVTIFFFLIVFDLAAWILLGLWFLFQILFPQEGVANWAHIGGFLAGMLTVLILGGRKKILASLSDLYEQPEPA